MMWASRSSRMSDGLNEPVFDLVGKRRQRLQDLRRHAREREAVGVAAVDDELHGLPGILFHDGIAQPLAVRSGEEPVEQPAQHRACVAREDVAQPLVLPGLLNQSSERLLVFEDGRGRRVLGQPRQRGCELAVQIEVFSDGLLELGDGLRVGIDTRRRGLALRSPAHVRTAAPGALTAVSTSAASTPITREGRVALCSRGMVLPRTNALAADRSAHRRYCPRAQPR